MKVEFSQNHNDEERLSLHLRLLDQVVAGHLNGLECPVCRQATVSAWFTHPLVDTYRTWFFCSNCDFHSRAQNSTRPLFFSQDRVRRDLEELDLSWLNQAVFKEPGD